MSRAARRRAERGRGTKGRRSRAPVWIMAGSVVAALVVLALLSPRGEDPEGHHPTPRVDAHAAHVMPAARYAGMPRAEATYAIAAEIPAVLDGVFCYCYCHQTFGHYSLLDCFRDDHGANCDVCMNEAVTAYEMTQRGETLGAVREAVDRRYRT